MNNTDLETQAIRLIKKGKDIILSRLINEGHYSYEHSVSKNKLIVQFNTTNIIKDGDIKYLSVSFSEFKDEGYKLLDIQYFAPFETKQAVDVFLERMSPRYPENSTGLNNSLEDVILQIKAVPKVYSENAWSSARNICRIDLFKSFLTHDSVAYFYENNTSLQLIRCKVTDEKNVTHDRVNIVYSDYVVLTNSNSQSFPSNDVMSIFDIFAGRMNSKDPSIKTLTNQCIEVVNEISDDVGK